MTPLAQRFLKRLSLGKTIMGKGFSTSDIFQMSCFDVQEIAPAMLVGMVGKQSKQFIDAVKIPFVLPNIVTWLEFVVPTVFETEIPYRIGYMLCEVNEGVALCMSSEENPTPTPIARFTPPIIYGMDWNLITEKDVGVSQQDIRDWFCDAICLIDIIQNPHLVEKETKPVHKGLAKTVARGGRNKLGDHIVVKVNRAAIRNDGPSHPGSPKRFHFVHAHPRHYSSGLTVPVSAHWRGDPALGILPRRHYKVKLNDHDHSKDHPSQP